MLKLLLAAGPGARIELGPEHLGALRDAIAALDFQRQVRLLALAGPAPAPAPAPHAHERHAVNHHGQNARALRPERMPRPERTTSAPDTRPATGAGAVWSSKEEAELKTAWESGEDIYAIATRHGRSPSACFSRLPRLGSVPDVSLADAARFLIHRREPLSNGGSSEWVARATALGFDPQATPTRIDRR